MMSEHEITETINSILSDVFNAIIDIISRIIQALIILAVFIVLTIRAYGVMAVYWKLRCDNNGVHSMFGMRFSGMARRF